MPLDIRKLTVIHISELETLQEVLHNKTVCIFSFLDDHHSKSLVQTKISMSFRNLKLPHPEKVVLEIGKRLTSGSN